MFGLKTYLENYGSIQEGKVHLGEDEHRHEFDDWLVTIPFAVGVGKQTLDVDILCCPEDKRCTNSICMQNQRRVCEQCEVPLCSECAGVVDKPWGIWDWGESPQPKPPPRALSNDLMIFYAPKSIYEDQMTVLELSLIHISEPTRPY